jgi:hypothetical protein
MTSQLNVDTIVDKAGSGGTNVKIGNTSTYVSDGGGATQNTVQGLVKCWAKIAADGASILDSFNVSSHDDDGSGDGGININNDMSSTNYVIQLTVDDGGAGSSVNAIEVTDGTQAAGSFDYENNYVNSVENRTPFNVDRYIAVLGDLA